MNAANKEYVVYNPFSKEKSRFAWEELPEVSIYYYLANQLFHVDSTDEYMGLYDMLITHYPDGELNDKLNEKYKTE